VLIWLCARVRVSQQAAPPADSDGYVRVDLRFAGTVIEPVTDQSCRVTYVTASDPRGYAVLFFFFLFVSSLFVSAFSSRSIPYEPASCKFTLITNGHTYHASSRILPAGTCPIGW